MSLDPNSTTDQTAAEESTGTRETPRPIWLELCVFVTFLLTLAFVFVGAAAICKLVWPHDAWRANFASVLLFLAWTVAVGRLKMFAKRQPFLPGKRYAQVFQFLFYFVFASSLSVLADKWQGETLGAARILGNCALGALYGVAMVWIVPLFPSSRKDPFAARVSLRRSG